MKPRRVKLNRQQWTERNVKALMKEYISTRNNSLFWVKWLEAKYEEYRGQ